MPLLTVITPSKNHLAGLRASSESLTRQTFQDWEHLVIDSASQDGTVEYCEGRPQTRIISEPDNSIEFALNKGLRLATGKYVTFLLCWDALVDPNWLQTAIDFLEKNPDYSMTSACSGATLSNVNYGYGSYPSGPKFNYYFFIAPWPILNETAFICPRSILVQQFPDFQVANRKQDIFFHFWINFFSTGYLANFQRSAVVNCENHEDSRLMAQLDSGEFKTKEHDFLNSKRAVRQRLIRGEQRIEFKDREGRALPITFSRMRFIAANLFYKGQVFWIRKVLRKRIHEMQYHYCQELCQRAVDGAV